jgi:hypothetical protein
MKKLFLIFTLLFTIAINAQEQCTAITLKQEQCKRTANKEDGKCTQHSSLTPRCKAETKAGAKCKLIVKQDGEKCHHHKIKEDESSI